MSLEIHILMDGFPTKVTVSYFTSLWRLVAHCLNIVTDLLIHEKHWLHSEELGASLSSHLCVWQLWVCTTALRVYTLLAVNGCVFTLDLIVSPPRLLLSTMFGTCLSAAVGRFKAGDTFVAVLVSAWVFVFWSLGKKKKKSFKWSMCSHSNVALICGPSSLLDWFQL